MTAFPRRSPSSPPCLSPFCRRALAAIAAAVGLAAGCNWLFPGYVPDGFSLQPAQVDLQTFEGDEVPVEGTVTLGTGGARTVSWTAVSEETWLTVVPSSGWVGPWEAAEVTVSADPTDLPAGIHTATVTFSDVEGVLNDVLLTVRLTLTSESAGTSRMEYYVSEIDDSLQPYGIYLPAGFVPGVGSPVAIFMHGFGGQASASFSSTKTARADAARMILVNSQGRGQHQYDGAAETDLFEVLADLDAAYKIDRSRLFLEGCSMGGTGAFRFIARHPDVFAGAAGVDGWTDYRLWHQQWYAPASPDNWQVHPAQIDNLEQASPLTHAENVLPDRLFIVSDTGDIPVYSEGDPKLSERLVRLGTAHTYLTNAGGHCAGYSPNLGAIYDFFLSREPLDLDPAEVRVRSNRLRTAKHAWFRVERFAWNGWAEVTASRTVVMTTCTYDLVTRNVARFTISAPPEGETVTRYVLTVDGVACLDESAASVSFPLTMDLTLDVAGNVISGGVYVPPGSPALEKRPEIEGPLMRALTERFVVAWGSAHAVQAVNDANQAEAQKFCDFWADIWNSGTYGFNSTLTPVDENDLTPADLAAANLVIFGSEESSALISDMASSPAVPFNLPVRVLEDQITLDGNVFAVPDHGIWMVHPNPLAPDRLVVLGHYMSGRTAGLYDMILWTHDSWPWRWPDYVVFDTSRPVRDEVSGGSARFTADQYVEWGFFDQDWAVLGSSDPRTVVDAAADQASYTYGTASATVSVTVEDESAALVPGLALSAFEVRIDGEYRPADFIETATPGVYEADVTISDLMVAGYDLTVEVVRPAAGEPVAGIGRVRFAIQ